VNEADPGLWQRLEARVWSPAAQALPGWQSGALRLLRTLLTLGRDLTRGELTLRAMSLVYTTLLSIVPLLALSFSVLKAFGVSGQIEPVLLNFLAPLGEKGEELAQRIVQFIANMNVGVLGTLGLALLLYTAISLMQKIEESLNFIWHVPRPRQFGDRFTRYLSVLMVGPILVFSALGITATVLNIETVRSLLAIGVLGQALQWASRLMPYLLVTAAFSFVYLFIPNSRVRLGAALIGGAAGGIAWQTAGWAFATFVASSNNYAAVYAGLAILILFMIWIYVSWLILLFGASVAFYVQHPEYLVARGGEPRLSNRMRERLALSVMSLVVGRFIAGRPAAEVAELTRELSMPGHALQVVLDVLERNGLLVRGGDEPAAYLPARDPSLITVAQVIAIAREAGEERFLSPRGLPAPAPVEALLGRMEQAVASSVGATSLRELAEQGTTAAPPGRIEPH